MSSLPVAVSHNRTVLSCVAAMLARMLPSIEKASDVIRRVWPLSTNFGVVSCEGGADSVSVLVQLVLLPETFHNLTIVSSPPLASMLPPQSVDQAKARTVPLPFCEGVCNIVPLNWVALNIVNDVRVCVYMREWAVNGSLIYSASRRKTEKIEVGGRNVRDGLQADGRGGGKRKKGNVR